MSNYMITKECLESMIRCFTSQEEFNIFVESLSQSVDEVLFTTMLKHRSAHNQEVVTALTIKQIFIMVMFCRRNIDVLHDLIRVVDYKEITDADKAQMDKDWNDLYKGSV